MAFKFGLETVLKHRKRLEDVAQREYIEAQRRLETCLAEIDAMYKRIDEVRLDINQAQTIGSQQKMLEIRQMEHFISGQKIRIEAARLKARELMVETEAKQDLLIEAAKDRKILLRLKEKRMAEYKLHLAQLEAKALDDLTSTRNGWGRL